MPEVVRLPFCRVVTFGVWNEPPRRRFAAYRCRMRMPRLLGHAVLDEFATLSSPVFFCPRAIAGKIYDAGLTLAHRRGSELTIDQGWPPLVVAFDEPAPTLGSGWQEELLDALREPGEGATGGFNGSAGDGSSDGFRSIEVRPASRTGTRRDLAAAEDRLHWAQVGEADVFVVEAPLLPKQLRRLCEVSSRPFTIAVAQGPVEAPKNGAVRTIRAASEQRLEAVVASARALVAERLDESTEAEP